MGKKKSAPPPTQEELDVEKYRLSAELAVSDAEELRRVNGQQQQQLLDFFRSKKATKEESDELYEYLDAQMLSSARDRASNEQSLRSFQTESHRAQAELRRKLDETERRTGNEIALLRAELEEKNKELHDLRDFRGLRPAMEGEIKTLRQSIADEQDARRQEEHDLQIDLWRQREGLNKQMMERIAQAKTNFLDITSEMLDSTVHRTMLDNQNMSDELALQSTRLENLLEDNNKLYADRASLRRELAMHKETEVAEVKRSLARRKLAATATAQHSSIAEELRLAQSELDLATERARVQDVTISKMNTQLGASQRKVTALMNRVAQQQQLIDKRLSGQQVPNALLPTPNWSLILPNGEDERDQLVLGDQAAAAPPLPPPAVMRPPASARLAPPTTALLGPTGQVRACSASSGRYKPGYTSRPTSSGRKQPDAPPPTSESPEAAPEPAAPRGTSADVTTRVPPSGLSGGCASARGVVPTPPTTGRLVQSARPFTAAAVGSTRRERSAAGGTRASASSASRRTAGSAYALSVGGACSMAGNATYTYPARPATSTGAGPLSAPLIADGQTPEPPPDDLLSVALLEHMYRHGGAPPTEQRAGFSARSVTDRKALMGVPTVSRTANQPMFPPPPPTTVESHTSGVGLLTIKPVTIGVPPIVVSPTRSPFRPQMSPPAALATDLSPPALAPGRRPSAASGEREAVPGSPTISATITESKAAD